MRPRPVPRPQRRLSPKSEDISKQLGEPIVPEDGDEMFMRNQARTLKTWKQLEEVNKDTNAYIVDSDQEAREDVLPTLRKKMKGDATSRPQWQRDKNVIRHLFAEVSDESDSSIEILDGPPEDSSPSKRKRTQRNRSRSITPPPTLDKQDIQHARNLLRQALKQVDGPVPPTFADLDDSVDSVVLDPELESIARGIAAKPKVVVGARHVPAAGHIVVTVRWKPHPLDKAGTSSVWMFKMNREDDFRDLFDATAEEAHTLYDNLVMTYKGTRIFSSVTPLTLKMLDEAELEACDKQTHEYLRSQPKTSDHAGANGIREPGQDDEDESIVQPPFAFDATEDKFRLILRSANTPGKDITLTVRPTTKCGAIVNAFLTKAGYATNYPSLSRSTCRAPNNTHGIKGSGPVLCVDGDKMDNDVEIGIAELEDGDVVDVVDL